MSEKFKKKPLVVEAVHYVVPVFNAAEILAFLEGCQWRQDDDGIAIITREGEMKASPGDWIIKEPNPTDDRKFYPCKPDIFAATYEPLATNEPPEPSGVEERLDEIEQRCEFIKNTYWLNGNRYTLVHHDVPWMLALIKSLQAENAQLRGEVDDWRTLAPTYFIDEGGEDIGFLQNGGVVPESHPAYKRIAAAKSTGEEPSSGGAE